MYWFDTNGTKYRSAKDLQRLGLQHRHEVLLKLFQSEVLGYDKKKLLVYEADSTPRKIHQKLVRKKAKGPNRVRKKAKGPNRVQEKEGHWRPREFWSFLNPGTRATYRSTVLRVGSRYEVALLGNGGTKLKTWEGKSPTSVWMKVRQDVHLEVNCSPKTIKG